MDAVGRLGGEEFMILLIDVPESELTRLAERVRSDIAKAPVWLGDHSIEVTCSVGCAMGGMDNSIKSLVQRADQALYRAKSNGRNRVELATAA
jgi:diguanylate cyclase (GGDEF)-like protein